MSDVVVSRGTDVVVVDEVVEDPVVVVVDAGTVLDELSDGVELEVVVDSVRRVVLVVVRGGAVVGACVCGTAGT